MIAGVAHTPLAGVRVLDVTTSIAGPYCAQALAALGADVIKVERPDTGDDGRAWGPPFWRGEGTMFLTSNAGKRSLAISLRDPRGREALLRLAESADVFLQSLRPGLADEIGLGADAVRGRNPRLVYCSVGAYGRVGPLRHEPGYDALMQAAGGLISMTGEPGRPGVRVGSSLIDIGTGVWATVGILAALLERERTGAGTTVDVSLYETTLAYIGYHLAGYLADGTIPHGQGTVFPMVAPYQVFPTRDGELLIGGGNDRIFASICDVLGLPELVADPRFASNPARVAHREELYGILVDRLQEEDTITWQRRLREAGVPTAPVANVQDVVESPQTEALGMLQALEHPRIDDLRLAALPLSLDEERVLHPSAPPDVGAHSADVLRESGFAEDEIAELAAGGVTVSPATTPALLVVQRFERVQLRCPARREDGRQDPDDHGRHREDDHLAEREREGDEVDLRDQQAREDEPEDDADHRPDQRGDHTLVADHPPRLPAGHADRPQHADLAGALEDSEHQRVDDAEEAHEHR